jgi:hypothetical protein
VSGRIAEAQLRLAFSWLEPLLPHRAPAGNLPP